MDDTPARELDSTDAELARVLAFPVGRSGTRSRRRGDAPASQPVRSNVGPERRLTIVRAALVAPGEAAPTRAERAAEVDADPDAAEANVAAEVRYAAHDVVATLLLAGADDLALEGSAEQPVIVAAFDGVDHAHRALTAASSLTRRLREHSPANLRFDVRTGVHTASVVDLIVGGSNPMPFRAVGTLYALAERLQRAASPGEILLSADTLGHVSSLAAVDPRGDVALNDHGELREAYSLLHLRADDGA
jgi:class 3 adenylate cyclase